MFYKKGVDLSSTKSMFNFLNEHFTYYTMSSWNGLKSIANNVKLYNLKLTGKYEGDVYDILNYREYEEIDDMIYNWKTKHPGYTIGFNGRSDGYLVLYNTKNNTNILPDYMCGFDNYEDFKQYCYEFGYGTMKDIKLELREYTKLVQDFDKLCDEIRDFVNKLSDTYSFNEYVLYDQIDIFNENYYENLKRYNCPEITLVKLSDGTVVANTEGLTPELKEIFEDHLNKSIKDFSYYVMNYNDNENYLYIQ